MVDPIHLRALIDASHEWLLVRDGGQSSALMRTEIEIETGNGLHLIGFPDDKGFHSLRLNGFEIDGTELSIDVAVDLGDRREILRLVPRISARELAAEVELARMNAANEIGRMIAYSFAGSTLERIALNKENGRIAQIVFRREKKYFAAMADLTATLTPESVLTAAMIWYDKLGLRKKKPVLDIWIIAERRRAKEMQKLHALLSERWRSIITVLETSRKAEPACLNELPKRRIRDLWREKAKKLTLPHDAEPSETARRIIGLSPDNTDVVYSKQGETIRYLGLPFACTRTVLGQEKAWFGIGRHRQLLTRENEVQLNQLMAELAAHRRPDPPNSRHELYRTAPEAWLESILRGNIAALDANLILAPIYNQFRSSSDKIDLLALRKDGRLVVIELKTQPDREMVFQAADYWRKIELQRRRGVLAAADLFAGREILDRPALVYLAAPALSFHYDFEYFARAVAPEIEIWRFELHERWRQTIKVLARRNYAGFELGFTNR